MNKVDLINTRAIEYTINARKTKDGNNYVDVPDFKPGDIVIVAYRVVEGEKERIQNYKGIVISRRGVSVNKTFLVRKTSNGFGVERTFPLFSPMIQSIEIVRRSKVRRAKLYYLRGMSERKIRQKLS